MRSGARAGLAMLAFASAAVVALPVPPAAAEETWQFLTPAAEVGDTASVAGSGWFPNEDVSIYAPGVDVEDEASEPVLTVRAESDGTFATDALVVPRAPGGAQSFTACQICSEVNGPDPSPSSRATLVVLPQLAFDPPSGLPSTEVRVSGTGWLVGADEVLLFRSEADSENQADLIGSFTVQADGTSVAESTLTVPVDEPGAYSYSACQQCGDGEKAWHTEAAFEVLEVPPAVFDPVITLATPRASVGQDVIVDGTGWSDAAGEVDVYADPSDVAADRPRLAHAPVEGGSFTTTITVPSTEAATLTLFACQECGADAELTAVRDLDIEAVVPVAPRLDLSTDSGSPGTAITATGTGWADGDVRLTARNDAVTGHFLGTATAAGGRFTTDLTVPDIGFGPLEVVACQGCRTDSPRTATRAFTVVKESAPSLTLDRDHVRSEGDVRVSGAGWSPTDGRVSVYLKEAGAQDPGDLWFSTSPLATATFSRVVAAPELDAGDYVVVACQRCGDASGFPRASETLAVDAGSSSWWLVVVVGAVVWLVSRARGSNAEGGDRPPDTPASDVPQVKAHRDASLDVVVGGPPTGRRVLVPDQVTPDVVAHPDPTRLAEQVEVWT